MHDIIVIGGGPAGMTAGLYAKRMGKSVLILEGENYGGQITISPKIENYPALKSISGSNFADNLLDQIITLGVETEFENVTSLQKKDNLFEIVTEYNTYISKSVIIATGCTHRKLDIEKNSNLSGLSYCAVCDGVFYKDKIVAVIGGGDSALQEALYLSAICKKVYIIHRREVFRACNKLVQKVKEQNNIELVLDNVVSKLIGEKELQAIELKNTKSNQITKLDLQGIFVAIGQTPKTEIFKNIIKTNEKGFIICKEDCKTSNSGIFSAGDCRTKDVRQLTTAVADGAVSAINACLYVDGIN